MTTGPRPTPHPIILHVDDNGNPVRLAEASAIYVTSAVIGTLNVTSIIGLGGNPGVPTGPQGAIQFNKGDTTFDGNAALLFDKDKARLVATEIVVGNFSGTGDIFFEEVVVANEVSSNSISSINSTINTLSSTTISAITVCAVNYNSLFDSLSFQNLDNRYLNSSGDSVTGSFYLENLSSVTISATSYRNLPSALATWNASAIRGIPVTSTQPQLGESLVFKDGYWQPSATGGGPGGTPGDPALSIQFKNGSFFSGVDAIKYAASISGIQSVGLSSTNLSSINIRVGTISATTYNNLGENTAKWNAQQIQDTPVLKSIPKSPKDILAIGGGGNQYERATISQYGQWVYDEIKPTIHAQLPNTDASAIRGVTVTSTAPTINNVLIYNGSVWTPSSAVSLATVSATNYRNLPTSSLSGLADVSANTVSGGQALIYSSSVNKWAPGYRIYQNNLQPNSTLGANGDIYFQILDSTGTALSSLTDTSIVSPSNGQTLIWNSSISKWQAGAAINSVGDASAIRGEPILAKEAANATTTLGALFHIYATGSYQTVPLNSSSVNGTRDIASLITGECQGAIVGSFLGSASEYFQINPYWKSPELTGILQEIGITGTYQYPDLPEDKDVLVFTENLYGKALIPPNPFFNPDEKAWTWQRLSLVGGYLLDVNVEDPALNQVLTYNGSQWVNSSNITQVSATGFYAASAELSSVKLTKYYEPKSQPSITANALTLNLNNSQIFDITLSSNISSITIQNTVNADNTAQGFTLSITYDATARTISWPASIKWPGSSAPVLTNTNTKTDIFSFITLNKGSSWLGFISGQNYSA